MTAEETMTRENEDDLYAALGVGRDATKTEVGLVLFSLALTALKRFDCSAAFEF